MGEEGGREAGGKRSEGRERGGGCDFVWNASELAKRRTCLCREAMLIHVLTLMCQNERMRQKPCAQLASWLDRAEMQGYGGGYWEMCVRNLENGLLTI